MTDVITQLEMSNKDGQVVEVNIDQTNLLLSIRIGSLSESMALVDWLQMKVDQRNNDSAKACAPDRGREHRSILTEAEGLVHGDRNATYGHPLDDYTKTAAFWSIILKDKLKDGEVILPTEAILMMITLKISREMNLPKRDNTVDGVGYFECLEWTKDEIIRRADDELRKQRAN